jgi:hypothetical protein
VAKKKKKSKNYYFTSDTEQAIISYSNTDCKQIREELYRQQIQPAFDELVDKIVYTYKFTSLENIDFLKDEELVYTQGKETNTKEQERN